MLAFISINYLYGPMIDNNNYRHNLIIDSINLLQM